MPKKREKPSYVDIEAEESYSSEYEDISEDVDGVSSVTTVEPTAPRRTDWSTFNEDLIRRYKKGEIVGEEEDDDESEEDTLKKTDDVPQHTLIPDSKSPRLWIVRVKRGKEKEVALKILSRIHISRIPIKTTVFKKDDQGMIESKRIVDDDYFPRVQSTFDSVMSVLVKPDLIGYIYVEAYSKQEVIESLSKIRSAVSSRISPVPLNEMIDVLSIKNVEHVKPGSFARIRKGKYRNDIAQVIGMVNSEMINVRLVPRLKGEPKLFNHEEEENVIVSKRDGQTVYIFRRETYIDGFLHKEMLINNLILNVEVSFAETKVFVRVKKFNINDQVKVRSGDLINLKGKVLNVDKEEAEIDVNGEIFRINCDDIEKFYNVGDEVSYLKRNGTVLMVNGNEVTVIFTDNYSEQVTVNMEDLEPFSRENKFCLIKNKDMPRVKRDPSLNKHVEIKTGEYKGYTGIIKDVYKDCYRILLDSNLKYINVDCNGVKITTDFVKHVPSERFSGIQDSDGESSKYLKKINNSMGGKTPNYGRRDYSSNRATPSNGKNYLYSDTPNIRKEYTGGKTPNYARDNFGGKTPNYSRDNYGNRTPNMKRDNFGGRTPNYARDNFGGRTPNYARDNFGGRTPNYTRDNIGNRTPNHRRDNSKSPHNNNDDYSYNENNIEILKSILVHPNNNQNQENFIVGNLNGKYVLDDNKECSDFSYVRPAVFDKVCVVEGTEKGFVGILSNKKGNDGTVVGDQGITKYVDVRSLAKHKFQSNIN